MSSATFLKLFNKSIVLNTARISAIEIHKGAYKLHLISGAPLGFFFATFGVFWGDDTVYKISEKKEPDDYKTITDWLKKN